MASELAKAYVQIVPSAKGIKGSITKELGGEASAAGESLGKSLVGKIGGVLAAAGIGKMVTDALMAGADLQQSLGGLDTIYGDAADAAKQYATEAAKAGISANTYAEQAVSFGAALKQAFDGDMVKSAEAANTAIMDMADNSAKFGTDIESIQNAYQGFAKQNYTMLDNLKLGYGGTKAEMERLLADAQALSGVEYDIDNLGDVYEAIHVIQEDLGVAGVAADEAKTTFTGSMNAMKSAAENFMANLTLGEDIGPSLEVLGDTVSTFITGNLLPMVGNLLSGLPELISFAFDTAIQGLNYIADNADGIVQQGVELISQLVTGIVTALPSLAEAGINIVMALGEAIINTDWIGIVTDMIATIQESISQTAPALLGSDMSMITSIMDGITAGLPNLLEKGVEIVLNVVNGIMASIPSLVKMAGTLISKFAGFLLDNLPTILEAGVNLVLGLVEGITSNLPAIVESAINVIAQLVETILTNLPQILETGIQLIAELASGVIQAIPKVVAVIPQVFQNIVNAFGELDWLSIGTNIIEGIKNGITNGLSMVVDAAKSVATGALDAIKGFLGIHSPSVEFYKIGQFSMMGLVDGIEKNSEMVSDAMKGIAEETMASYDSNLNLSTPTFKSGTTTSNSLEARVDMLLMLLERYLPECAKPITIDGESMMNTINRQLGMAVVG